MTEETPETQPMPGITDQAAFFTSLGVDPNTVMANSLNIGFDANGNAVVRWTSQIVAAPHAIAFAFLAGGGMVTAPEEEQPKSRAVKRAAAKKTAAKKAAPKT